MSERLTEEQQRIVEENIRLAYMMARKYRPPYGMDFEDWQAECLVQLAKAVRIHNAARGTLATILDRIVLNTRMHFNKRMRRTKHGFGLRTFSSDQRYETDCTFYDFFGREHEWGAIDNRDLCEQTLAHLSERELVAFRMLSEGCSHNDIGEHLGVTRSRASQLIAKAREKLANRFPELLVTCGYCLCCGKPRQQYSHVTTSYCTECGEIQRANRMQANQRRRRLRQAQAACA